MVEIADREREARGGGDVPRTMTLARGRLCRSQEGKPEGLGGGEGVNRGGRCVEKLTEGRRGQWGKKSWLAVGWFMPHQPRL